MGPDVSRRVGQDEFFARRREVPGCRPEYEEGGKCTQDGVSHWILLSNIETGMPHVGIEWR
jgi:hypothetical protein